MTSRPSSLSNIFSSSSSLGERLETAFSAISSMVFSLAFGNSALKSSM
jgi:hypothetical protein